jgi:hypothetical protein
MGSSIGTGGIGAGGGSGSGEGGGGGPGIGIIASWKVTRRSASIGLMFQSTPRNGLIAVAFSSQTHWELVDMADPLIVLIPHKLGKEEALRRIRPALSNASSSFPILSVEQETWTDDQMDFRVRALGQIAAGRVDVTEDQVRLEVTLPWLLQKFAEKVLTTIQGRGRVLLEKK